MHVHPVGRFATFAKDLFKFTYFFFRPVHRQSESDKNYRFNRHSLIGKIKMRHKTILTSQPLSNMIKYQIIWNNKEYRMEFVFSPFFFSLSFWHFGNNDVRDETECKRQILANIDRIAIVVRVYVDAQAYN